MSFPVPVAMRAVFGVIFIVLAIGLALGGIGRVLTDVASWYKDEMRDPYRELRKKARATARARKNPGESQQGPELDARRESTDGEPGAPSGGSPPDLG